MGGTLPLSGIRVLDLTSVLMGPYTTQLLGDFGADVIKVEAPDGDMTRQIGIARNPGMSALFLGCNRNKRSVVLDLKRAAPRAALWRLIEGADMFVHNIRPQKIAALGFDADAVLKQKDTIVYGALHGYREEGPYAGRPAYDDVIQGEAGVAGLYLARDGAPEFMPTVVADKTVALLACNGLIAGLLKRFRSGKGVYMEAAMFEGMASYVLLDHHHAAMFMPPEHAPGYPRTLSRERRPYKTADGFICMLAYTARQWQKFWELAGRPEVLSDARFDTVSGRAAHTDELYAMVSEVLAKQGSAHWLGILKEAEIPAGPVNRLEDLREDPHMRATGFFRPFSHPSEGELEIPDTAFRFDREALPVRCHQPRLGEHTAEVLAEAGFSAQEIGEIT